MHQEVMEGVERSVECKQYIVSLTNQGTPGMA